MMDDQEARCFTAVCYVLGWARGQLGAASENGKNRTLSKWDVVFSSPHAEWKPLDCTDAGRFVFRWVENTSVSQMITFG